MAPETKISKRYYATVNLTKGYENPKELIEYIEKFGNVYHIINRDEVMNYA